MPMLQMSPAIVGGGEGPPVVVAPAEDEDTDDDVGAAVEVKWVQLAAAEEKSFPSS